MAWARAVAALGPLALRYGRGALTWVRTSWVAISNKPAVKFALKALSGVMWGVFAWDLLSSDDSSVSLEEGNDAFMDLLYPPSIELALNAASIEDSEAASLLFTNCALAVTGSFSDTAFIRGLAYMTAADYFLKATTADRLLYSDDEVLAAFSRTLQDMSTLYPKATEEGKLTAEILKGLQKNFQDDPTGPSRKRFDFFAHFSEILKELQTK
jgi:hypothetical protein